MAVSSDIKLRLYNGALRRLGDRSLASLSENREPRRVLDDVWGSANEIVKWALEIGEWNFGLRAVEADYNPSVSPGFGFQYGFDKPSDMRRLAGLSAGDFLTPPLTAREYVDEAGYWFANHTVLYIRYVSDGDDYGMNSAAWTEVFKQMIECKLAWESCERLTNAKGLRDRLERDLMQAKKQAKSHDAMQEGVKFPPDGSWVRARDHGRNRSRWSGE